jgi:hypothetical protein
MKKQYYLGRDKLVEVEELENVLAVRPERTDAPGLQMLQSVGKVAKLDVNRRHEEAFQKSGWQFLEADDELHAYMQAKHLAAAVRTAKAYRNSDGHLFVGTDHLVVKLSPELTEAQVQEKLAANGLAIIEKLRFAPNLYEVAVESGVDIMDKSVQLHSQPDFLYAEPQLLRHIGARYRPSDPDYSQQWQWQKVDAEPAWNIATGKGVAVAVIDNGIKLDHADLEAAVIELRAGYYQDAGNGSASFNLGKKGFPDGDHGTFCAGMAVARANNNESGCGLAFDADLIPIACLEDQTGSEATLARAVAYAADPAVEGQAAGPKSGAAVVSCSLGPASERWELSGALDDALKSAASKGTLIFWAVADITTPLENDEVCSHPAVAAVACSDQNDMYWASAYGARLEFMAPGVSVASTLSSKPFGTWSGTSFAAPVAAACAALILQVNPRLSRDEVLQIMRDTCDKIGYVGYDPNGHHDYYGYGRINAYAAVCKAQATLQAGGSAASASAPANLAVGATSSNT